MWSERIKDAAKASAIHLLVSSVVAVVSAALVFGVWYPRPLDELADGWGLFTLLVAVDVVCGPLLTLVVFDKTKPRTELWRDLTLIATLQLIALLYGMTTVYQARPVYMAFEGDRFRVVTAPDVDIENLPLAQAEFRVLPMMGPRLVGTRLSQAGDPDFLKSVDLALNGLHPSFRPARWRPFDQFSHQVRKQSKSLDVLRTKAPDKQALIDGAIRQLKLPEGQLGYLPVVAGHHTDWVAVIRLDTGVPLVYLPLDGW